MSDTQVPGDGTADATPTEALELADQQPIAPESAAPAPAAAAAAPSTNHTRTILEVVGGVVAAGLIVVAGVLGFAVGHATGDDDGRLNLSNSGRDLHDGPSADGQQGQGMPGEQGFGQGMPGQPMPGEQGFGQGMPGEQGFGGRGHHDGDGRGIDQDGDNWTGQGQDGRGPDGLGSDDLGSDDLESSTPTPTPSAQS